LESWFEWKGERCTEYGIHVVRQPEIIRPNERVTFTAVPGRSGTLTLQEGWDVYDDFLLSVECAVRDTAQLNAMLAWLKGSDKVTFANRQGGFYFAHIVNQIPFEQVLRGRSNCRFTLTFRCQPFFYLTGTEDITVTASGTYVTNPGMVSSEPKLAITLAGDAEITVGGSYFTLNGLTGIVTVDTALMETYQDYTSCNSHLSGDYPTLLAGQNIITWTGGVTKIVITPHWRML
jgi:phage-related protein